MPQSLFRSRITWHFGCYSTSQDARFNRDIDLQTGYRTKALLCMPIKDSSGVVIGVAQVINKLNCERFTENDEKVICVGEHVFAKWNCVFYFAIDLLIIATTDIFVVSTILWNWSQKCATVWKISIGSETKSSSIGFGTYDIWRAKHHWTHGAADFNAYAKPNPVPTCSGEQHAKISCKIGEFNLFFLAYA